MNFVGGCGKKYLQNGKKTIILKDKILVLRLQKRMQFAWAKTVCHTAACFSCALYAAYRGDHKGISDLPQCNAEEERGGKIEAQHKTHDEHCSSNWFH